MIINAQSFSISVPCNCKDGCPNSCAFCVSRMHDDQYINLIERDDADSLFNEEEYLDRMMFARDNNINTLILTGSGEPVWNRNFLKKFAVLNEKLGANKFRWIEVQTSGICLDDDYLGFLRRVVKVKNISLSLSDMFDFRKNTEYNGIKPQLAFHIFELCQRIKRHGFGLRLSLNMTDSYNDKTPQQIFEHAKTLGANQITFRKLYTTPKCDTPQDEWILQHGCKIEKLEEINNYILVNGVNPRKLSFGSVAYIVNEISTVIDSNCMDKSDEPEDVIKYLILREDCKLYHQWDNLGSLLY